MGQKNPMSLVPKDLRHLVPGFLARRDQEILDMAGLIERKDFRTIQDIAHRLKGNGAGFGFPLISDIGEDLELAAIAEDLSRVQYVFGQLVKYLADVRAALR